MFIILLNIRLLKTLYHLYYRAEMDIDLIGFTANEIGAHGARETPVTMPNTEVKPRRGYNTWGSPLGK